ncbi:MAG: DUF2171 domain-containing protein [Acinetobacter sp.]
MSNINEHDLVQASCGKVVGKVDHLEGSDSIKLTRSDDPNNEHHTIPTSWVEKVENGTVYLNKNSAEVEQQWKTV